MSNEKSKKRAALFLLLVIGSILAVLMYVNNKRVLKSSFIVEGKNKLTVTGEVSASKSGNLIFCVKDLIIEADAENIRAKNVYGKIVWSQKLPGKVEKLAGAGESIVIIDSQNNIDYYSLQGKLLWTYKAPSEIIDIFTEDNGSFLVEYKGMTGSHVEVFTQKGIKIGSIVLENASVLSFSTGTNAFSISALDTSAEVIKTEIITYNLKGDILWAQNFSNMIVSKLNYSKNNRLLAVGENSIYIYENNGSLKNEVKIEGKISNVSMSDHIIAIALQDKSKQYAVCYDSNMRECSRTEIKAAPLGIFPMKNNFILYYNDELSIITLRGGLTARFRPDTDISRVYASEDNKIYIVSNRKLQQLEYEK